MNEKTGKQGITKAVKFFFKSMEMCDLNQVGLMVLEHLKNHINGLYKYFMTRITDKESVGVTLTEDINKHFRGGYNLIWGDWLNHCMVDYDIIRLLKNYAGYTGWTDVSIKQKELCYRTINNKFNLLDWNIQQERC